MRSAVTSTEGEGEATQTIRVVWLANGDGRPALERALARAPDIEFERAESITAVREAITAERCDCLVLGSHPGAESLERLVDLVREGPEVATVILIDAADEERAVTVLEIGALDYLSQDRMEGDILATKVRAARRVFLARKRVREAEAELRETVSELRREAQARENVVSIVSHDLRGPLNNIGLALSLLESDDASQRAIAIGGVRRAVTRAEQLISDLLDAARMSGGQFELARESVVVRELIDTAAREVEPTAEAKRVSLKVEVGEALGEISADRGRILQALDNLLRNALEHSPADTAVELRAEVDDEGLVELSVRDQGPGLPAEVQDQVFDKFWQAKSSGKTKGSGLGLAIAKGVVEAHGGEIGVRSAEGAGACFWFKIPRAAHESVS